MATSDTFTPPLIYRLFFLYIEPLSALVGAYYAAFLPATYLALLSSTPTTLNSNTPPDTPTLATLYQLANLYFLFALNEHLVLSRSSSLTTWRTLLFGLFLADLGHLATMIPVSMQDGKGVGEVFWKVWRWNGMEWGGVGFVYVGAGMRVSFLVRTSEWWRGVGGEGEGRKEE